MEKPATAIRTATDLGKLFAPLADQPGAVWLDSSLGFGDRGQYSFIARNPAVDVCVNGENLTMRKPGGELQVFHQSSSWDLLERLWADERRFSIGYISYEASLPFVGLESISQSGAVPSVRFLFYDSVLKLDHLTQELSATNPAVDDYSDLTGADRPDTVASAPDPGVVRPVISRRDYLDRVRTIKRHIREGDIYQANFTTRLDVRSSLHPFDAYNRLRSLNPAPYSAWLNFGDYRVLSSSPERMFLKCKDLITTGPIKGTIATGESEIETLRNRQRLLGSDKDRAELLMIVDLERNDLGRISCTGSVHVDELYRPETYSSVIHLVSDISARLQPQTTMKETLAALLPGGSITGAPKKRAVEILRELETAPRSVYTGVIGYVHGDRADFSIAIRTMTHADGVFYVYAGGGIVADSEPEAEYDEMRLKASNMLRALCVKTEDVSW
ncbi:MAG: anthranilate synthase component I family protein [candidate division Zixibacteria bacterium]|nr:anthranilate synthase component I family protein [candidate division Zixibacteria bacterium]